MLSLWSLKWVEKQKFGNKRACFPPFDFNIHPFVLISFTRRINILTFHWHIWFYAKPPPPANQHSCGRMYKKFVFILLLLLLRSNFPSTFFSNLKVTPWKISQRIRSHCYSNTLPLTLISSAFHLVVDDGKLQQKKTNLSKSLSAMADCCQWCGISRFLCKSLTVKWNYHCQLVMKRMAKFLEAALNPYRTFKVNA